MYSSWTWTIVCDPHSSPSAFDSRLSVKGWIDGAREIEGERERERERARTGEEKTLEGTVSISRTDSRAVGRSVVGLSQRSRSNGDRHGECGSWLLFLFTSGGKTKSVELPFVFAVLFLFFISFYIDGAGRTWPGLPVRIITPFYFILLSPPSSPSPPPPQSASTSRLSPVSFPVPCDYLPHTLSPCCAASCELRC
ncbi:hypothetical protein BZA05DRAFT_96817 [Tricharina praecox]|uniref:uncharacterized protein n=1 Tax=Tricharina praecox TaxID=43433 RepID=UPI00221E8EEA|nr:uncharacterized protein BZA05DRAFT_96817 [Tricharina praecox]KAI5848403.1 hypothetical protein BZA05DRAFT_96817 [Tricharina praecox]